MGIVDKLEKRVSPKIFDGTEIPNENLMDLISACNLAPTSFGIQPVRLFIPSKDEREKLISATYNQPQIASCSELLVFSIMDVRKDDYLESYIKLIQETTGCSEESVEKFKIGFKHFMRYKNEKDYHEWASKQAYLTLGILVAACASLDIDCCPIEGFQDSVYGEILELDHWGLTPVIVCAIGKASPNDPRSMVPKVRIHDMDYYYEN